MQRIKRRRCTFKYVILYDISLKTASRIYRSPGISLVSNFHATVFSESESSTKRQMKNQDRHERREARKTAGLTERKKYRPRKSTRPALTMIYFPRNQLTRSIAVLRYTCMSTHTRSTHARMRAITLRSRDGEFRLFTVRANN